eukprot:TRINITY_DN30307_c0_g1_i1.p1 TRINITY_DN30307_c0_g1~~TRINITY_DN30307_c0_g1_i1.p1  ORF type:complete len:276 (-),score=21.46 TRINITY_DN30307_c0_g1_i1:8-835(-)
MHVTTYGQCEEEAPEPSETSSLTAAPTEVPIKPDSTSSCQHCRKLAWCCCCNVLVALMGVYAFLREHSRAEHLASHALKGFDELDDNHDGLLSKSEFMGSHLFAQPVLQTTTAHMLAITTQPFNSSWNLQTPLVSHVDKGWALPAVKETTTTQSTTIVWQLNPSTSAASVNALTTLEQPNTNTTTIDRQPSVQKQCSLVVAHWGKHSQGASLYGMISFLVLVAKVRQALPQSCAVLVSGLPYPDRCLTDHSLEDVGNETPVTINMTDITGFVAKR